MSDVATRGRIVSSLRSEPRSFNRHVRSDFPIDLYQQLTGSKLVRVNRVTAEPEPALAERWSISPDNKTFTLTSATGWSGPTARRSPPATSCSHSRRPTTRARRAPWPARCWSAASHCKSSSRIRAPSS